MRFDSKLYAIKALRDLGSSTISLKDAKGFVEAVMAFGVERYLKDELGKRGVIIA